MSAIVTRFHCASAFSYALCCFKVLHCLHDQLSCSRTNNIQKTYRAAILLQHQRFLLPRSLLHCELNSGHIRICLNFTRAREKDGRRRGAVETKLYSVREVTVSFVFLRYGTNFCSPHSSGTLITDSGRGHYGPRWQTARRNPHPTPVLGYLRYMTLSFATVPIRLI